MICASSNRVVEYRRELVGKRENCLKIVPDDYPVRIDKEYTFKDHTVLEGSFDTPFVHCIPDLLPKEIRQATYEQFQNDSLINTLNIIFYFLLGFSF